jgi:hypothetical protein
MDYRQKGSPWYNNSEGNKGTRMNYFPNVLDPLTDVTGGEQESTEEREEQSVIIRYIYIAGSA